ncbi:MAG: sortase [bacterium]
MALYKYKKRKSKIIPPKNVKKPFYLPLAFFSAGLFLLAYVGFPYLSFYTAQFFKVDNYSKELLSPADTFSVYAADNKDANNDYNKNLAANIAELDKEIKSSSSLVENLTGITGKMYITIDKLGLKKIPIVINTNSDNESSYNPTLSGAIAHFKGTSLPGHSGKTFLYGHSARGIFTGGARTFSTGIFTDIDKLNLGDEFTIDFQDKTYKYSVYRVKLVNVDDVSAIYGEKRSSVSLMTCKPDGIGSQRLIVEAYEE